MLSLGRLPSDELRRLAMLLLFDAVADHVISHPDVRPSRHRRLRHVLALDEAWKILAEKKYESLADLVRKGASKG